MASQHVGASSHKSKAHPRPTATPVTHRAPERSGDPPDGHRGLLGRAHHVQRQADLPGVINAGATKRWTEHQPVSLVLGNPAGVALTVNGKNAVPTGATQPVTLTLGPGQKSRRRLSSRAAAAAS